MDFEGAIFDVDGTLVDSMGVWHQVDADFFQQYGAELPTDYSARAARMGAWQTAEYTISLLGLSYTPQELIDIWNAMVNEEYLYRVPLKPYAKEYLEQLKKKGISMAVVTALFPELYEPVLKRTGVYEFFDVFLSSGQMKLEKSSPEIFLLAARQLSVSPSSCVVFEDVISGVLGAKAAGMTAVGVYDFWNQTDQALLKDRADRYIIDFSELLQEKRPGTVL